MRKVDVAYNPPLPFNGERKKAITEMDMDELQELINNNCLKCRGDFTICDSCKGCLEGRLLVDKLKEIPEDKPKDKTREIVKMKHVSPAKKQEIAKKIYHDALMSENPVAYMVTECGITEKRAKERLHTYSKKYAYVREKVVFEKAHPEHFVDGKVLVPKRMVDIIPVEKPKKEQTVGDLVSRLRKERNDLTMKVEDIEKRIQEIDSTIRVIESMVG